MDAVPDRIGGKGRESTDGVRSGERGVAPLLREILGRGPALNSSGQPWSRRRRGRGVGRRCLRAEEYFVPVVNRRWMSEVHSPNSVPAGTGAPIVPKWFPANFGGR